MSKKKTTEEFKKEVYDLVESEYEVVGEYINAKTPISIKHNICNYEYLVSPDNFKRGRRCPNCRRPNYHMNTEKFKEKVSELTKNEYVVLSEYVASNQYIILKHNKCGHKYPVIPASFLRGRRCPKCYGNKKRTTEEFKKEVYNLVKNEYEVLSEYINRNEVILMKHNECGYEYSTTPSKFINCNNRCPKCMRPNYNRDTEQFKKEVYDLVGNEYEVLGEYIKALIPIALIHNKCGHFYKTTPNSFLRGSRCPKCYGTPKKTTEQFKKEVYQLVKNEYEVIGEYTRNCVPIKMKHNKCEHVYLVKPNGFLRGNRCPKCSSSKGEIAIAYFLDKYKIYYKHNNPYRDCSYKSPLRFDFLIFDKEQNLKLIVEFDGIQHFEPVDVFGGEEGLKETQARDKIKNDFCKENSIPLVRIPYWEIDNIPKILGKKLYKLGLL